MKIKAEENKIEGEDDEEEEEVPLTFNTFNILLQQSL